MDILSYLIAFVILLVVLKIIAIPFKIAIKFIINSIIGGLILAVLAYFGIGVIVTWWMVALTGLFGIPGAVISIILTMIL